MNILSKRSGMLAIMAGTLVACGGDGGDDDHEQFNALPAYLGAIASTTYDGVGDDLLTAGLGKTGLGAPNAPTFADPLNPTPAELRRNAIYTNYRAVLDNNPNSGYGTMYGPNVDAAGNPGPSEGKVAGTEYIAFANDGGGAGKVTLMVQVPANFDVANPCIITAASSGSRGIYGAIGSAGEWGLKHGCAVAYTDKGTGTGLYTFDDDGVNLRNGVRAPRAAAGPETIFAPPGTTDTARAAFAAAFPNRVAFKHAHSQQNPEKDWGKFTLQSIEFAYYVLNEQFGALAQDGKKRLVRFSPGNTIVIASSISNGGGAALLAAEQDSGGLIDGVAVSEPQIQPRAAAGIAISQGGVPVGAVGKTLYDYASYAALYQPCVGGSAERCAALAAKGLLSGADLAARQLDAYARLHAYGWQPGSDILQGLHAVPNVLVTATYSYAYGRFAVLDDVCGVRFAATDAGGNPVPFSSAQKAQSFAAANGILGNVVYEGSVGGARAYAAGVSPSSGSPDQSLDAFLCLRALATGADPVTGQPLMGALLAQSERVRSGVGEVQASGNLRGKPALIVHGRNDTLVPVNHASRAYLGLNAAVEGQSSRLRYVEVTNANHFDAFSTTLPTAIVPLHIYLFRALDAMYAHLKSGAALPPSQVVHTQPRASATVPVTNANLPPIALAPGPADTIMITGSTVAIPD